MNKLLTYLSIPVTLVVTWFLFFMASPAAASTGADDAPIMELAKPVWEAITQERWWLAASLALVLAVAAFKRYAPGRAKEFANSDAGGALLVLLGSFGAGLASGLMAVGTNAISWVLVYAAVKVAIVAAGGYSLVKKLIIEPLIKPNMHRFPPWLQSTLTMVMWIFERPAVEAAEKAGDVAVAADPAGGVADVVGEPKELS